MRKFKKALAFALASAMIVSAVPVSAATTNTAKAGKTTIYTNGKKNVNNVTWIKTTTAKGYTVKLTNKTTSIISLSGKKVTAKKAGSARVDVTFYKGGKKVSTKKVWIKVKTSAYVQGASIAKAELNVGETTKVSTTNADEITPYYYSADKNVVTVNKTTGEVKAVGVGSTTISVYNANTGKSVKVAVTVVADAPVAKQSGANTITITNGVEMDTTDLKVTKGSTSIATDKVELSADKKTITITTSSNLTDGTYTVTFGSKTLELSAATEKVNEIKILSDKAAVVAPTSGTTYTEATVGYRVYNQFGEDITDSTTIQASGTGVTTNSVNNGKVTFTSTGFIPNRDIVSLVLIHTETGVTTQATLTVSDVATISELTYEGLYNADNKELTENSDPSEYYLLFSAKDQYGNDMVEEDLSVNGSDSTIPDLYITLAGGITNLTNTTTTKVITKDGTKYLGVKLGYATSTERLTLGTASLTAIAAGSGKSVTANIEVVAGTTVDSFAVTVPGTVVAGEEVVLEYTALDRSGNVVTDYDELKRITGVTYTTSDYNVKLRKTSSSKAELVFTYTSNVDANTSKTVVLTFTTPTYKISTVQLSVQQGATPAKISGANDGTITATLNADKDVTASDLKIIDSYGREIDDDDIDTAFNDTYQIKITPSSKNEVVIKNASGSAITDGSTVTISDFKEAGDTKLFTVSAKGTSKGDGTVTVELYKGTERLSTVSIPVRVADVTTVSNVTATVGTLYVPAGTNYDETLAQEFKQSFTVKAKTSGDTVTLSQGTDKDYTLTSLSSNIKVSGNNIYAGTTRDNISAFDSAATTTDKVRVTLSSGESYDVEVTLTKTAPTVKSITVSKTEFDNVSTVAVSGGAVLVGTKSIVTKVTDSNDVAHTTITTGSKIAGIFSATVTADDKTKVTYDLSTGTYTVRAGETVTFTISYGNDVTKVITVTN